MPTKTAQTVPQFLDRLPAARRREVERVWALIRQHVPAGYEEAISRNMLVYQVPLSRYPDTYNGQPLWYVALASEKSYLSLHLMSVYGDAAQLQRLKDGFRAAGKKLDMGKACIHFRSADDLALDIVANLVASMTMERWVEIAQSARRS